MKIYPRLFKKPWMYLLYFVPLLFTLELFEHKYLIEYYVPFDNDHEYHVLLALFDNFGHFLVAILTWAIVIEYTINARTILQLLYSGFVASFVDIDHFIMARSFKLRDAIHLEHRPFLHNSTLPQLLIPIILLPRLLRQTKFSWLSLIALVTYTSILSHQLSDGRRRGLWVWPIGNTKPLRDILFICIFGFLISFAKAVLYYDVNLRSQTNLVKV